MSSVTQTLLSVQTGQYMDTLNPANRYYIKAVSSTLANCSGKFNVLSVTVDADQYKTEEQALRGIFDISIALHRKFEEQDESILSPLGVARHIAHALSAPEKTN